MQADNHDELVNARRVSTRATMDCATVALASETRRRVQDFLNLSMRKIAGRISRLGYIVRVEDVCDS